MIGITIRLLPQNNDQAWLAIAGTSKGLVLTASKDTVDALGRLRTSTLKINIDDLAHITMGKDAQWVVFTTSDKKAKDKATKFFGNAAHVS